MQSLTTAGLTKAPDPENASASAALVRSLQASTAEMGFEIPCCPLTRVSLQLQLQFINACHDACRKECATDTKPVSVPTF